jgi:ATP-dependent helicase HrpB
VLEAEPGAGKTTRVPLALLEAGLAEKGRIIVTEPRRLAARLAASFVAKGLGEPVGKTVGYSMRFEHAAGRDTKILYATEGVVQKTIFEDPRLTGVAVVVLDEFHERHLATDVLLALVTRLRRTERPDLRLVVMSATLEGAALAEHLDAPRVHSKGRSFPLAIEHAERPDDRPLDKQVAGAVRRILKENAAGDVLVFLPGAREIRQCSTALAADAQAGRLDVLPLHGDLSVAEQTRAVEPSKNRKIILSTNVAESSVTIDGVTAVVDTGLARVAGHSPWSGLPTLVTSKISRASATQRAGRAGRTQPGRVLRLYTSGDLRSRPEHDKPEILREDLAEILLGLAGAGIVDVGALEFLDRPPREALDAARALLGVLGAVDGGAITDIGRRMLAFPLAPRLARVVVEGERRGVAEEACLAAALLSERDIRTAARADFGSGRRSVDASGPSDILELIERFREASDADFDPRRLTFMGVDARAARSVDKAARQVDAIAADRGTRPSGIEGVDEAVQVSVFAGFADRLARRKNRTDRDLILSTGRSARLADTSVVHDAALMVALDAEEVQGRGVTVRLASAVDPAWVFELCPGAVDMTDELVWNSRTEAVVRVSRIALGSVILEEDEEPAPPSDAASAILLATVRNKGPTAWDSGERLAFTLRKLSLLRKHMPELGIPEVDGNPLDSALEMACRGRTKLSEVAGVDFAELICSELTAEQRTALYKETPEHLTLPGGRAVPVHYEEDRPPWIESRLQDFFGMTRTPTLCKGRVPLTVHLLAPNQRAVQVTTDLAGFWDRHYPALRRELGRRYPRHPWPEDGKTAVPPAPRPRRS